MIIMGWHQVADAEVIIPTTGPLPAEIVAAAPKLRLILQPASGAALPCQKSVSRLSQLHHRMEVATCHVQHQNFYCEAGLNMDQGAHTKFLTVAEFQSRSQPHETGETHKASRVTKS